MSRTTFFTAEITGPCMSAPDGAASNDAWAIYERTGTIRTGHRPGTWSAASLNRMAARSGIKLVSAYSVRLDSKGYIESSKCLIV